MDNLASPWQFPRQKEAVHYADLLADAPARALALFAPRQTGKTHFLTHDLTDEVVKRGWHAIYIDLWGASSPLGAIHGAIALAYNNTLRSTLNRQVSKVGAAGLSLELVQDKPPGNNGSRKSNHDGFRQSRGPCPKGSIPAHG